MQSISMTVRTDPAAAHEQISQAFKKGGSLEKAADLLDVSTATLTRLNATLVKMGWKSPNPNPSGGRRKISAKREPAFQDAIKDPELTAKAVAKRFGVTEGYVKLVRKGKRRKK